MVDSNVAGGVVQAGDDEVVALSDPEIEAIDSDSIAGSVLASGAADVYGLIRLSSASAATEAAIIADVDSVLVEATESGSVTGFQFDGLALGTYQIDFAAAGLGVQTTAALSLVAEEEAGESLMLLDLIDGEYRTA